MAIALLLAGGASCRTHQPIAAPPVFPLGATWNVPAENILNDQAAIQFMTGDGGQALLSLRSGALQALDCKNGAQLWARNDLPGAHSLGEGLLVVARRNGALRALDFLTGKDLWKSQTGVSEPMPPLIDKRMIVVAGHGLASIDVKTGSVLWTRSEGRFTSPPRIIRARIVLSDSDGTIHGFDASTGRLAWTRRANGALISPASGDQNGRVFIGTSSGWFLALRASNGGLIWRWRVGAGTPHAAIAYEERVLFAGDDAVLYALKRRNGHMIWRAALPSRPLGPLLLAHKTLLIPCYGEREGQSTIVGVDVTAGRRIGVFETSAELAVPPIRCGESFVLGLRNRSVVSVAYQSPTPTPTPSPTPSKTPLESASPVASPTPTATPLV